MPYKDKNKRNENQRRYYREHLEQEHASGKKYRETHRAETNERVRQWTIKNKERILKRHREYREANREQINEKATKKRGESRLSVFQHYGMFCACCGESTYEFLTIDHINGGGNKHYQQIKNKFSSMYNWLVKNGFPEGFQTLCYNCNCAKWRVGCCPHQKANVFEDWSI